MLREALLELINEKGLHSITVSDLTQRADINRGTFYLHYRDIEDMMKHYQNQLLNELKERLKHMDLFQFQSYKDKPYPVLVSLLEFVAEQADLFSILLGPSSNLSFPLKWKNFMKEQILEKLLKLRLNENKC